MCAVVSGGPYPTWLGEGQCGALEHSSRRVPEITRNLRVLFTFSLQTKSPEVTRSHQISELYFRIFPSKQKGTAVRSAGVLKVPQLRILSICE